MSKIIPIASTSIANGGPSINGRLRNLVTDMRTSGMSYQDALHEFGNRYIAHLLRENGGHLGNTALSLGMHRNTLTRTLRHGTGGKFASSRKSHPSTSDQ